MDGIVARNIQEMTSGPVSDSLLSYITDQAALVIPCLQTPSNYSFDGKYGILPPLPTFIEFLVKRSGVRAGTLLASLVFLKRLHTKLASIAKGMPCTAHRVFLATLIVTSKSIHDTSPKNKHWARFAAYFNLIEINLMEKQLLSLMDYDVLISHEELSFVYMEYRSTITPILPSNVLTSQTIIEADLPMYAAMYSNFSNSTCSSLDSIETPNETSPIESSILEHVEGKFATLNTNDIPSYYNTEYPPKAHCRDRRFGRG